MQPYFLLLSVLYMFREVFHLIIRSSKTVYAAADTCQTFLLLPLTWKSRNSDIRCCMYSFWAPDDERKNRSKHVQHWKQ